MNIQTVGDWIQFKRMEKKFTLAQVARKMGIAHALVRSWEAGIRQPDHVQLAHLKHVLDMQFDIK